MNLSLKCFGCYGPSVATYCVKCIREIFSGKKIQSLSFNPKEFYTFRINTGGKMSISGMQDKISVKFIDDKLVPTKSNGEYILKPVPSAQFNNISEIVANEHLFMQMSAQIFNIPTARSAVIPFENGELAYITKRFDRISDSLKLDQEDFASVMMMSVETHGDNYKYDSSYEAIAQKILDVIPGGALEVEDFYKRIIFNFLIGNGDAHLKNFSLYRNSITGALKLTPSYDILCTKLHINEVFGEMALDLFTDYETDAFVKLGFHSLHDFEEFGLKIGIPAKRLIKIFTEIMKAINPAREMIGRSFLSKESQEEVLKIFDSRFKKAFCYTIPGSDFAQSSKIKPIIDSYLLLEGQKLFHSDNSDPTSNVNVMEVHKAYH